MATRKRLKRNKQRGMYKRNVIRGKKPMAKEQKEAQKKIRESQRAASKTVKAE